MNRKFLVVSLILFITFIFVNICYATDDIVMDLNSLVTNGTANTFENSINNQISNNTVEDNTMYSPSGTENVTETVDDYYTEEEPITTTTTEYEDSGELSITNMINIILIVVGVVLILLGIAIIIRLNQK